MVNNMNRDFVWDQVVDVVDDYFRIQKEERVKLIGDMLTEGRIDTYPRSGSTIFEPWNKDSATPYDRWEATLQSIRRTALVRVIPAPQGFTVDVQVYKELENVVAPESGCGRHWPIRKSCATTTRCTASPAPSAAAAPAPAGFPRVATSRWSRKSSHICKNASAPARQCRCSSSAPQPASLRPVSKSKAASEIPRAGPGS